MTRRVCQTSSRCRLTRANPPDQQAAVRPEICRFGPAPTARSVCSGMAGDLQAPPPDQQAAVRPEICRYAVLALSLTSMSWSSIRARMQSSTPRSRSLVMRCRAEAPLVLAAEVLSGHVRLMMHLHRDGWRTRVVMGGGQL